MASWLLKITVHGQLFLDLKASNNVHSSVIYHVCIRNICQSVLLGFLKSSNVAWFDKQWRRSKLLRLFCWGKPDTNSREDGKACRCCFCRFLLLAFFTKRLIKKTPFHWEVCWGAGVIGNSLDVSVRHKRKCGFRVQTYSFQRRNKEEVIISKHEVFHVDS